ALTKRDKGGLKSNRDDNEEEEEEEEEHDEHDEQDEDNEHVEENDDSDDPFPHDDYSRIDFRTLKPGNGTTYPLPYSFVRYKYLGYIHHRDTGRWEQFTPRKIANYEHRTQLGVSSQVPGLEEALLTMSEGEKAKVWVPSRLGYGTHGAGGLVPPNSDLVFIITLLAVEADDENDVNLQMSVDNENTDGNYPDENDNFGLSFFFFFFVMYIHLNIYHIFVNTKILYFEIVFRHCANHKQHFVVVKCCFGLTCCCQSPFVSSLQNTKFSQILVHFVKFRNWIIFLQNKVLQINLYINLLIRLNIAFGVTYQYKIYKSTKNYITEYPLRHCFFFPSNLFQKFKRDFGEPSRLHSILFCNVRFACIYFSLTDEKKRKE
ncbi:FKBP-type peptidyl-prolyl cis-trans isomerase, partial [Reticulomyxa filosa]